MERKNITKFLVLAFALLLMMFVPSSASTSTPLETGSSSEDRVCNYLFDYYGGNNGELFDDDASLPGIDITLAGSGDPFNTYLKIGFDASEVGSRTWWDGNSNFTWTFNCAGASDPALRFESNNIYLENGRLAVNVDDEETHADKLLYIGDQVSSGVDYGIYQETAKYNYLPGHTLIGDVSPIFSNRTITPLIVHQTGLPTFTHACEYKISQDVELASDGDHPTVELAEFEYTVDKTTTSTSDYIFLKYSTTVTVDEIDPDIEVGDYIKLDSDSGKFYRKITGINTAPDPDVITLEYAYLGSSSTGDADYTRRANRLGGSYSTCDLNKSGLAEGIRGVVGKASLTGGGTIMGAGVGTRGSIEISQIGIGEFDTPSAYMGWAVPLTTYGKIDNGTCDRFIGMGVETPIIHNRTVEREDEPGVYDYYKGTVTKDVVGIGVMPLLYNTDFDAFGPSFEAAYGLLINDVNPNNLVVDTYGIYVAGDDDNYLGGDLEVNKDLDVNGETTLNSTLVVLAQATLASLNVPGTVDFDTMLNVGGAVTFGSTFSVAGVTTLSDNVSVGGSLEIDFTSKVKCYSNNAYQLLPGSWAPVKFNTIQYDRRIEYDTATGFFTADEAGYYDVKTNILFLSTATGDKLEVRIVKLDNQTPVEYSYAVNDGYASFSPMARQDMTVSTSDVIPLLAGEKIWVEIQVSAARYIGTGLSKTYLTIHRLS